MFVVRSKPVSNEEIGQPCLEVEIRNEFVRCDDFKLPIVLALLVPGWIPEGPIAIELFPIAVMFVLACTIEVHGTKRHQNLRGGFPGLFGSLSESGLE